MTSEPKMFSRAEVAKHNSAEDCWIVMDSKVYDVSKFLNEHPGGGEVIKELAGKDATVAFQDVGHSKDAKEMATQYLIGELNHEDRVSTPAPSKKEAGKGLNWMNLLIPTAIGITVLVLFKGASRKL